MPHKKSYIRKLAERLLRQLDPGLRLWWKIYVSVVAALGFFSGVVYTIAQQGPAGLRHFLSKYAYLLQLAHRAPFFFWTVVSVATVLAVAGFALIVWDWYNERFGLRREYLIAMEKEFQYVPLVIDAEKPHTLQHSVFQSLTLQFDPKSRIRGTSADLSSPIQQRAEDVNDVLGRSRTRELVIFGDPGSGKTTVLSHWMLNAVKRAQRRQGAVLPVFVRLRPFAPLLRANMESAIANYFGKYGMLIHARIARGEALLFLDGLDEVDQSLRPTLIDWIDKLELNHQPSAVVIGTRYSDYSRDDFLASQFAEWVVQPMDRPTQEHFAGELLPALHDQLPDAKKRRFAAPSPVAFMKELDRHPHTAVWGSNPLLFSLAAYVFVQDNGHLPPSGVGLYARSIDALLEKTVAQEVEEPRSHGARELAVLDVIRQAAAEAALRLFDLDAFTEEELGEKFQLQQDALPRSYPIPVMVSWVIRSRLARTLGDVARFEFIHRTFQEYLVAVALARRLMSANDDLKASAWDVTRTKRFLGLWFQPMRMLAGCLYAFGTTSAREGRAIALDWLKELTRIAEDPTNAFRYKALEVVVGSLIEIPDLASLEPYVHVEGILVAWADALVQTANQGDAGQLASLQRLAPRVPREFARPAVERLNEALTDPTQPALQVAAAQALSGMGDQVDINPLVATMQTAIDPQARLAAAQALVRLTYSGGQHPGHALLLEGLNSGDVAQRRLIAGALSVADLSGEALIYRAMEDGDAEVRRLGIRALGNLGGASATRELYHVLDRENDPQVVGEVLETLGRLDVPEGRFVDELSKRPEPVRSQYAIRIFDEWDRRGKRDQAARVAHTLTNLRDTDWPIWEAYAKYTEEFEERLTIISKMARKGAGADVLERAIPQILPEQMRGLGFQGLWRHDSVVIIPPMVNVPAGAFWMGSDDGQGPTNEPRGRGRPAQAQALPRRRHEVSIGDYQIAAVQVTVAEWACARAARAKNVPSPPSWSVQRGHPDFPVVANSWLDVNTYIAWLRSVTGDNSWRLPTEAEWEKAACWDEQAQTSRVYPWGNTHDDERANVDSPDNAYFESPTPVGYFASRGDASPYGCHDMAGNIWDFTSSIVVQPERDDVYQPDAVHEDPTDTTNLRVRRGGSHTNGWSSARSAFRRKVGTKGNDDSVGFRLARGATPALQPAQ